MSARFQRASLLTEQQRFEEALNELNHATAEEANNPFHHGLHAIILLRLNRPQQAFDSAAKAIELSPDIDYGHYVMALVHVEKGNLRDARKSIQTAIEINPADETNFGVLARIEFQADQWSAALKAADQGLQLDPSNDACRHWRSQALLKLGRREEAAQELDSLMADDPNDPYTHDAKGWMFLEQGDATAAKRHFLEALRIDPNFGSARHGLANALKARHALYGILLQALLYLDRFSSWSFYIIAIGLILVLRFSDKWAAANPDYYVAVWLAKAAFWIGAVALMSAQPLFDLVLRLDKEGRHALTPDKIRASNWNAVCMASGLAIIALWAWKGGRMLPSMSFAAVALTSAVTHTFDASSEWVRRRMGWTTVFAAALIPLSYVMLIVALVVAVRSKTALPGLVQIALLLPAVSILISSFSSNIAEYFERRRPDQPSR